MSEPTQRCIIQNCRRERASRGLCLPCFHAARKLIRSGKVTEEYLIENGLMVGDSRRGRKGAFYSALLETREDNLDKVQ